jgi:hypothetical protein
MREQERGVQRCTPILYSVAAVAALSSGVDADAPAWLAFLSTDVRVMELTRNRLVSDG